MPDARCWMPDDPRSCWVKRWVWFQKRCVILSGVFEAKKRSKPFHLHPNNKGNLQFFPWTRKTHPLQFPPATDATQKAERWDSGLQGPQEHDPQDMKRIA